ncbi:hypothetical protein KIPB_015473, partial [Kipferlia bialata]
KMKELIKANVDFLRMDVSKEDALRMFAYNKYKVELINSRIADGETASVFRCGNFIDLCRGPHVARTGLVKALWIQRSSGCYWKGDQAR